MSVGFFLNRPHCLKGVICVPKPNVVCFQGAFEVIAKTRMAGLPIVNVKLGVQTIDFVELERGYAGGLVTPWSIGVLWVWKDEVEHPAVKVGHVETIALPAGDFSFLGMNEESVGDFMLCSLMSPVHEIADDETALAVCRESLKLMLGDEFVVPEEEGTPLKKVIPIVAEKGPASRRDFFKRYWG